MLDGDGAGEGVEVLEQLSDAHLVAGVPVLLPEDVVGGELVHDAGPALRGRLDEQLRGRALLPRVGGVGGVPRVHHPLEDAGARLPERVGHGRVVHPGPQAERPPRRLPRVDRRPSPLSRSRSSAVPQVGDHLDRGVHARRGFLARIPRGGRVGRPRLGTGGARGWIEAERREGSRGDSRGGAAAEGSGEQRRRCQARRHGWWWYLADAGLPPAMWEWAGGRRGAGGAPVY